METQTPTPDYLKGFNHGYSIQMDDPALSEKLLSQADMEQEYWSGFESGIKEFDQEKSPDKTKQARDKDQGQEMER